MSGEKQQANVGKKRDAAPAPPPQPAQPAQSWGSGYAGLTPGSAAEHLKKANDLIRQNNADYAPWLIRPTNILSGCT
ncbi:Uu.00g008210.m01.CDS01 [Anthostomella pinea]|uniref:Uu.00g008210.m01.CDS01 n=1 Tax=Anthostomella pinea TaxID=933095 RepID=A0AAI8VX54_9PEZI|nr:Uu.00g008210.m01.CDS01 [Anthostomella pinea]